MKPSSAKGRFGGVKEIVIPEIPGREQLIIDFGPGEFFGRVDEHFGQSDDAVEGENRVVGVEADAGFLEDVVVDHPQ